MMTHRAGESPSSREAPFPARFPFRIPYEKGLHVMPSVFIGELLERFRASGLRVEIQDAKGARITDSTRPKEGAAADLWGCELAKGEGLFFKYDGPPETGRYINFLIAAGTALTEFTHIERADYEAEGMRLPPREAMRDVLERAESELGNQLDIWKR